MADEKKVEQQPDNTETTADAVTEAANQLTVSDDKDAPEEAGGEQENGDWKPPQQESNTIDTRGSNEERKVFVGGISAETTNEDLLAFFSQFGAVSAAQVKYDRVTLRSRGFAFVEFQESDACKRALKQREHTLKGKQIEVKPAKSRENKKVFVGGLPADFPEEKLREHFEAYGKVEDIEWPFDRQRNVKRNFAFVVFETEEGADEASREVKQMFGERECDVKKATPQSRRGQMGGPYGGYGGYGAGMGYGQQGSYNRGYFGGRAGGRGGMQGFNAYAAQPYQAWGGGSSGSWNDWNNWNSPAGGATNYGGYYGSAYGGGYGTGTTNSYGGGAGGGQGGGAAGNSDYWANTATQPQQQSANTWGATSAGGTFDSYSSAAQTATTGGARQPGQQRSQPYQGYQH